MGEHVQRHAAGAYPTGWRGFSGMPSPEGPASDGAAREMTSATKPAVADAADQVVALTDEYLRLHYEQLLHEPTSLKGGDGEAAGATNDHCKESTVSGTGEPPDASRLPCP